MVKNSIIKKIQTTEWWQCEGPLVFQLFQPPSIGFAKMAKYLPGLKSSMIVMMSNNDYGYQFASDKESANWIKFLINKDEKDGKYIVKKIKEWREFEKRMNEVIGKIERTNLAKISPQNLWQLFDKFYETVTDTWAIPVALDGGGMYFEKVLAPRMAKECGLSEQEASKKLAILTAPEKLSFIKKERISLLKICLDFIREKTPLDISIGGLKAKWSKIYNALSIHQKSFFWIQNNYRDTKVISLKDFLKEIANLTKNKTESEIKQEISEAENTNKIKELKDRVKKEIRIPQGLLKEIEYFPIFGWWQDERKRINLITSHFLTILIKEISKRIGVGYKIGYYLLNREIKDFLVQNKKIRIGNLEERRKLVIAFIYSKKELEIVTGKDAEVYRNEIFKSVRCHSKENIKEIKGYVACSGGKNEITGKASIILDVKKDKLEKGNILVTSMTRPEFAPLMKKAIAVITNEGGVTSHAAIISRELNIPCVIGTKKKTKIIHNNDAVRIDLNSGIIKLIKK